MVKKNLLLILLICIILGETTVILLQNTIFKPKTVLETIKERKSVRHYIAGKQISEKDITTMLEAAMSAPTAANKQPWEFIVIKDRTTLNNIAEKLPFGRFLKFAPLAIIVAGNMDRTLPDNEQDFWIQDASAATQNLLLAAEYSGLGAVWTGVYPMKERVNDISKILNLPKNIIPLNVIIIGYPTGVDKAKNKIKPEYVHLEKY